MNNKGSCYAGEVDSRTVIATQGLWHPNPVARHRLRLLTEQVRQGERVSAVGMRSVSDLEANFVDFCILYFHHPADCPDVVAGLDEFVRAGGALLAVHGALASFKGNDRYRSLLGGVFLCHGPISGLDVSSESDDSGRTFTLVDEPYEVAMNDDVEIRWTWRNPDPGSTNASSAPAAWVRRHGSGRVACLSLGHRAGTWTAPGVRAIVRDLVGWCEADG